jgi:hypothetical protein
MAEKVGIDLLKALAGTPGPSGAAKVGGEAEVFRELTTSGQDRESYVRGRLDEYGLRYVREEPWNGGTRFILEVCPFNPEHTGSNKAIVGVLPSGAIFAMCQHASCDGKGWHELRDRYEPGWRGDGGQETEIASAAGSRPWPVLDEAALYGLAGEIVRAIEPSTESATVAILIQLLVYVGNLIGRGPFFEVEATEHHTNLFAVLVGKTSKGRKGTSENWVLKLMQLVDADWVKQRVKDGLSSGEGLMLSIRDSSEKKDKVRGKNEERVIVDPGVTDKRALFRESEFASVLTMAGREGNTLSTVLRNVWDGKDTGTLTRQASIRVTKPHVSVAGHITQEELLRKMPEVEAFSGFANRFLWICVDRSKCLPEGGADVDLEPFAERLAGAVTIAQSTTRMSRDQEAAKLWAGFYTDPARELPGLAGAATSRSEAQTLRLSMIYALLDESDVIRDEHLRAAIALWQYAEDSARYIFGDATGEPKKDKPLALESKILDVIRRGPVTTTGVHKATSNKIEGDVMQSILSKLERLGKIKSEKVGTRGRSAAVWTAVDTGPES